MKIIEFIFEEESMKNCFFTICAKNYIAIAQVLEKSIMRFDPDCLFYIFIADEAPAELVLPKNVIESKTALQESIGIDKWDEMAFKYNLVELCTSIKPYCFKYLFDHSIDKAIYLDPDILAFSSLSSIFSDLDSASVILTPHITTLSKEYQGDFKEKELLGSGAFNLGFLALKKCDKVLFMLDWWGERLKDQCFLDVFDNTYTDQKWMDLLPCFFDNKELSISTHLGMNVAPWNFFERKIYHNSEGWYVKLRDEISNTSIYSDLKNKSYPLMFVHYSGYDYNSLLSGKVSQRGGIRILNFYKDIENICELYGTFLANEKEAFDLYIELPYTYSKYENGVEITQFHRRLFRSLNDECKVSTPFSTKAGSFYSSLRNKKIISASHKPSNVDKLNKVNLTNIEVKLKKINWIMRTVFRVIGINYYALLLRLMRPYSRVENHIHLLDSQYGNKLK